MPDPRRWSDADFYRAYQDGHFDSLAFNAFAPGECRCADKAWAYASATQRPEHGQVTPEEVRSCRQPSTWCERVRLSCSNTARLSDALIDAGFIGDEAQDAELLRRMEAAERAEEAQGKVLAFGLAPDRDEVLLRCSVALEAAGFPIKDINEAGRALRKDGAR